MIFDKLLILKTSLDFYKESKNIIKKILYYLLLRDILKEIKIINESIIGFEILSEFQKFAKVADPFNKSNIKANDYTYSNTYAEEIIIEQGNDIGDIVIILRHKNNTIEIKYPVSLNFIMNREYRHNIESNNVGPIKDKDTIVINNSIRNHIYNFMVLYMKGEYDNEPH